MNARTRTASRQDQPHVPENRAAQKFSSPANPTTPGQQTGIRDKRGRHSPSSAAAKAKRGWAVHRLIFIALGHRNADPLAILFISVVPMTWPRPLHHPLDHARHGGPRHRDTAQRSPIYGTHGPAKCWSVSCSESVTLFGARTVLCVVNMTMNGRRHDP